MRGLLGADQRLVDAARIHRSDGGGDWNLRLWRGRLRPTAEAFEYRVLGMAQRGMLRPNVDDHVAPFFAELFLAPIQKKKAAREKGDLAIL